MKKKHHISWFLFSVLVCIASANIYAQKTPEVNMIPCLAHVILDVPVTNVTCKNGSDGAATVVGYTTGPCTDPTVHDMNDADYFWSAPLSVSGRTVNGLSAGTYTVTWQDPDLDCAPKAFAVTISEPSAALDATTSVGDATCGKCNGTVDITFVTNGPSPYNYLWTPGNFTSSGVGNRCPGIYSCKVTDGTGCTVIKTMTVTNTGGNPTVNIAPPTNVSCFGGSDGSATATATLGGGGPYAYSWTPSGGNSATANGLSQGTYTVTATVTSTGCFNKVGSSRVDLQACKLEYSIVSPK